MKINSTILHKLIFTSIKFVFLGNMFVGNLIYGNFTQTLSKYLYFLFKSLCECVLVNVYMHVRMHFNTTFHCRLSSSASSSCTTCSHLLTFIYMLLCCFTGGLTIHL